jgi:hypothetical protein
MQKRLDISCWQRACAARTWADRKKHPRSCAHVCRAVDVQCHWERDGGLSCKGISTATSARHSLIRRMTCMKRSTTPPPPTPPHPSQDSKMVHTPLLVELKIAPSDTRTLSTWPSPWEASTSTGQGEDNDIVHVIGRHRRQAPRSLLKQRRLRQHTAMTTRRSKS